MKLILSVDQSTQLRDAEDYVYNTRVLLSVFFSVIAGLLPWQSWFNLLPLLFALAYPIRQIELKTGFIGQDFLKQGLLQIVALYLFIWFFIYDIKTLLK